MMPLFADAHKPDIQPRPDFHRTNLRLKILDPSGSPIIVRLAACLKPVQSPEGGQFILRVLITPSEDKLHIDHIRLPPILAASLFDPIDLIVTP